MPQELLCEVLHDKAMDIMSCFKHVRRNATHRLGYKYGSSESGANLEDSMWQGSLIAQYGPVLSDACTYSDQVVPEFCRHVRGVLCMNTGRGLQPSAGRYRLLFF